MTETMPKRSAKRPLVPASTGSKFCTPTNGSVKVVAGAGFERRHLAGGQPHPRLFGNLGARLPCRRRRHAARDRLLNAQRPPDH